MKSYIDTLIERIKQSPLETLLLHNMRKNKELPEGYLSDNLTLNEVTKSNTAIKLGIDNTPTEEHLENLKILAEKVFQPLRTHFGKPIYISSGYRSQALNKALKGAKNSHHTRGMAIDIDQDGYNSIVSNKEVFYFIKDNLKFTQLIWEFYGNDGPAWVHVSYDINDLRNEILQAVKVNNKTIYEVWKR